MDLGSVTQYLLRPPLESMSGEADGVEEEAGTEG